MSPAQTALLLTVAFVLDFWAIGKNNIRDRIAFFIALAALYVGLRNSAVGATVIRAIEDAAEGVSNAVDAPIARGFADIGVTAALLVTVVFTLLCLAPESWSSKLGNRAKQMNFTTSTRINWKLWLCAFLLAVLADAGEGLFGRAIGAIVGLNVQLWVWVSNVVFGV